MNTTPLLALFALVLLTNCKMKNDFPTPNYSVATCQIQQAQLNFLTEMYALNGMPFEPFNQKIVGWIPDETEPTFYIISYQMILCDYLKLSIDDFDYQLEAIGNPDGYWYEITTSQENFTQILNGAILEVKFKKWEESNLVEMEMHLPTY